mmetsp:Transcript_12876/g.19385  ORF Transcript_12876/g.19385 Transcript_12876/m.19385 type:complete len:251 (-) Transcript_12876:24-776(-)
MPAQSASEFFSSIPLITKYVVGSSVVMSIVSSGMIDPYYFVLLFPLNWQYWRLLTNVFYFGPLAFPVLINLMMFLQYSKQMEEEHFKGRAADYVWCLILGVLFMTPFAWYFGMMMLSISLMLYLVYIWCNSNPRMTLSLMFIPIQIPSVYFPWALLLLNYALRRSFRAELVGIVAGHIYYFLTEEYPARFNKQLIYTPGFLLNIFPPTTLKVHGFSAPGRSQVGQQTTQQRIRNPFSGGHSWGSGRRLGN